MQSREQEVARSIAREDAPRAVPPVGGRGEADDSDPRARIAEPGDRTAPVLLVGEAGHLLPGDLFAPGDQPWACPADDHLGSDRLERVPSVRCASHRRPSIPRGRGPYARRPLSPPGSINP